MFSAIGATGSVTLAADAPGYHDPGNQWLRRTARELLATPGI